MRDGPISSYTSTENSTTLRTMLPSARDVALSAHAERHAGLRQKCDAEMLFDVVTALCHGAADVRAGDLTDRTEDDVNDADEQHERVA